MMNFNTLKIVGNFALAAIFCTYFTACSDENHAGVLTETESGTTIARIEGIVKNENGKPVPSAKVNLISSTHIAARMAPIKTATTDDAGKYTIDSVSAGDYALQISNTERTQSGYQTITIEDDKTNTQKLKPETSLEKNASLEISLSTYALDKGDTLCITGTLNCIGIDEKNVKAGTATLSEIPPTEFTNITLIKGANRDTSTRNVKWDFTPGEKLEISPTQISVSISKDVMSEAQKLNGNKTLDSMIVPITLNTNVKNPVLLSDKGDTLALYKVENDKNGDRYLTVIPNIDVGTYNFTVASTDSLYEPKQILKSIAETEPQMNVKSKTHDHFEIPQENSFAIGFWISIDKKNLDVDDTTLLEMFHNDVRLDLKINLQMGNLCTNFYRRDSTDSTHEHSYYTTNDTFCTNILDGKRHYFTLFIKSNHIVIAKDGNIDKENNIKINFNRTIPGFTMGNNKLKNLTVFSLSPSTIVQSDDNDWERLHAWLSALYLLQK